MCQALVIKEVPVMKRTLALILVALMAFAAVVCWGGNGIVAHADDPQFSANVTVGLVGKDSGDLYYGDTVLLSITPICPTTSSGKPMLARAGRPFRKAACATRWSSLPPPCPAAIV